MFGSVGVTSETDFGVDDDVVVDNMHRDHVLLASDVRAHNFIARAGYFDDRPTPLEAELGTVGVWARSGEMAAQSSRGAGSVARRVRFAR